MMRTRSFTHTCIRDCKYSGCCLQIDNHRLGSGVVCFPAIKQLRKTLVKIHTGDLCLFRLYTSVILYMYSMCTGEKALF